METPNAVRRLAGLAAVAALVAAPAVASPPPDPISIDAHSPSIFLCQGKNAADIYGEVTAPIGQGCDLGFSGPVLHVAASTYGLTAKDEQDGHSNGERTSPDEEVAIYFSGDRATQGVPGTHYAIEENNGQAAGDRYVTFGFAAVGPAGVISGGVCNPPTSIVQTISGPRNQLSLNQDQFNLIPSIRPSTLNKIRSLDNQDAVEITLFDLDGDRRHDTPVYFTVDKVGPTLNRPSHIYFTPPGGSTPAVFSTATQLKLTDRDNVDAIAVWDVDRNGVADPGRDFVIFSLDRGSPSLAGRSPADLFVSDFTGEHCLYLRAAELGLNRCDNVDAVDVEREIEIFEEAPFEAEPEPTDPDEPVATD